MENTSLRNTILLDSTPESINIVTNYIDEIFAANPGRLSDNYGNIIIAITEAVNNAISHGNKKDPNKKVEINFIQNKSYIHFTVEDEGNGFDYNSVPDPTAPENLEKINGRGIFLMKNLVDKLEFHKEGKKVELIFELK